MAPATNPSKAFGVLAFIRGVWNAPNALGAVEFVEPYENALKALGALAVAQGDILTPFG